MVIQIANLMATMMGQCITWMMQIFDSTDGTSFWLTAVMFHLLFKYILSPLFGAAHSDSIKTSYNAYKNRKKEKT